MHDEKNPIHEQKTGPYTLSACVARGSPFAAKTDPDRVIYVLFYVQGTTGSLFAAKTDPV